MSKRTHAEALETKKNILAAAHRVFSQKGFAKTSLSDIAREANVTRGAIYWHFENKSELLASLIEEEATRANLFTTLRDAVAAHQRDPLGALKTWAMSHLTEMAANLFTSSLSDTVANAMNTDGRNDVREKIVDMVRGRNLIVEEALQAAVEQKQLPADLDVGKAGQYLCAILSGIIEYYRLGVMQRPLSYYTDLLEVAFASLSMLRYKHDEGTYAPSMMPLQGQGHIVGAAVSQATADPYASASPRVAASNAYPTTRPAAAASLQGVAVGGAAVIPPRGAASHQVAAEAAVGASPVTAKTSSGNATLDNMPALNRKFSWPLPRHDDELL